MNTDPTEEIRRRELVEINQKVQADSEDQERRRLEQEHGKVWNSQELADDFEVLGFLAPYVVAVRKSDRKKGSLQFQHHPRFYFAWEED